MESIRRRFPPTQIQSRWGPVCDFEQVMEHAIVHVLRIAGRSRVSGAVATTRFEFDTFRKWREPD